MVNKTAITWMDKYLRLTDYLSVAQIYLKDNVYLKEPLKKEHLKERPLGHFGTVPGLNCVYAALNYVVKKEKFDCLLVTGPGHGAPAILSNLFYEEALNHFYPKRFPLNEKGALKIAQDFSWPGSGFPSHVTPGVPGSILEGGELGYSLSTAFGAALDNKDLIVAAVVGDGEAESGPLAAAWNSNKFLNPKVDGAVLPIVHVNHYKISNPTIFGAMTNKQITNYFEGLGYMPLFIDVKVNTKHEKAYGEILEVFHKACLEIKSVQKKYRGKKNVEGLPKWPVIIFKHPKGWKGIKEYNGKQVEGTFHSHGVPLKGYGNEEGFRSLEKWLKSYKIDNLIDKKGVPIKSVLQYIPEKKYRLGFQKYANGGKNTKDIKLPNLNDYAVKVKNRGELRLSRTKDTSAYMRDIISLNKKDFRLFAPDEVCSNLMDKVFEVTKRPFMLPLKNTDEHYAREGRVMEILSEHTIQGWLQGYLLTGRYGIFTSYEAFISIISSMVDQHAKFIKQSQKVSWRADISPLVYILTSLGWRQEHNGYSHQNPSFVSNILQKQGSFSQVYYPVDVNSMLVAMEESLSRKNTINVIVAGKRPLGQLMTLSEARKQAKTGMAVWSWVTGKWASFRPDVVAVSCGDYITQETLAAVELCKEYAPDINIRFVNVSEVTSFGLGEYGTSHLKKKLSDKEFDGVFTKSKPVVFNYHGYTTDVQHMVYEKDHYHRFFIHGYSEEGSTTTPFDMMLDNKTSRYDIAIDLIARAMEFNKKLKTWKNKRAVAKLKNKIKYTKNYIKKYGKDPDEVLI